MRARRRRPRRGGAAVGANREPASPASGSSRCRSRTPARRSRTAASEEELARAVEEHRRETELGLEVRWEMEALRARPCSATGGTPWRSSRTRTPSRSAPSRASGAAYRRRARRVSRSSAAPTRRRSTPSTGCTCARAATRASPTQPKRFIDGLGALFKRGHGFVALVSDDDQPDRRGRVPAAARPPDLQVRRVGPRGARAAAEQPPVRGSDPLGLRDGLRELDFGRTDLDQEGLQAVQARLGRGRAAAAPHLRRDERRRAAATRRPAPARPRDSPFARQALDVCSGALYRHFG